MLFSPRSSVPHLLLVTWVQVNQNHVCLYATADARTERCFSKPAVATNSLFHATFLELVQSEASQNVSATLQEGLTAIRVPLHLLVAWVQVNQNHVCLHAPRCTYRALSVLASQTLSSSPSANPLLCTPKTGSWRV